VGIVMGVLALLIIAVAIFLIIFLIRRKKKQNAYPPAEMKQTNQTPMTVYQPPEPKSEILLAAEQHVATLTPEQKRQPSSRPSDAASNLTETLTELTRTKKSCQIAYNELVIEKDIGEGSYGKVCLGKWNAASVALKFCRKNRKIEDFLQEMKIMIELPPHPNVVQVLGLSVDGPQPIIVMEFCPGGSLDTLLYDSNVNLNEEDKMQLIRGIAAGMLHLHKHNIVHRDLAARNILLTASGDPKISDFGMSRLLEGTNEAKVHFLVNETYF